MNVERFRIVTGLVVISLVWGSTWLAIKIGLESVPPFLAAAIRFGIASAVLFAIIRARRLDIPTDAEARMLYLVLSVLSYSIPFALVYWGQQFIPTGLSSILFAAYPFSVALFSHYLLPYEPLDAFKLAGICIGFAGIVVIFAGDIGWSGPQGTYGMLAILASTVLQGLAMVLVKKHGQPINPFALNFVGMALGAALLMALSLAVEDMGHARWDTAAVGSILYLALVGSVVGFVTFYWLLKRIQAVYLSLVSFVNPVLAVILGALVLGEALPPAVFAGAALVLGGIMVANRPLRAFRTKERPE